MSEKKERIKSDRENEKIADYIAIQFAAGMNMYWEFAFQQLINLGIITKCNDDFDTWIRNL